MVREGRVFIVGADTNPDFASSYYVTMLEVGAQVSAIYDGSAVPVRAGHGFAANDKFIVVSEFPATTKLRTVTSVDATHLFCATVSVAVGDVLVNLGADTETVAGTPDYTSPGLTVYSDMALTQALTNNATQTDSNGRYRYYHAGISRWELVRNGSVPIALYQDTDSEGVGTPSTVTDNAVARWDGTDGHAIQNSVVTIGDTGATTGISTLGVSGTATMAAINASGLVAAAADVTVGTTLTVTGTSTLAGVNASGTVAAAAAATVGTSLSVGTTLEVNGDATFSANVMRSVATVSASTTHSQSGTALTKDINVVSVCANTDDAVVLPSAVAGMVIRVIHKGAQSLRIWPASGDDLGAGANTQRAALAAGASVEVTFIAMDGTTWEEI